MKPTFVMTVCSITLAALSHTAIAQAQDMTLAAVVQPAALRGSLASDRAAIDLPQPVTAKSAFLSPVSIALQPQSLLGLKPEYLRQVAESIRLPSKTFEDPQQELTLIRLPL
jgi:hypothetical protein